jgi:hypothetical protein
MVEDNFRATTIADLQVQGQLSYDINERFSDRLEAMAALMPAVQAQSFTRTVNEECQLLLDECKCDPKAAYRRLGISLSRNQVFSWIGG